MNVSIMSRNWKAGIVDDPFAAAKCVTCDILILASFIQTFVELTLCP